MVLVINIGIRKASSSLKDTKVSLWSSSGRCGKLRLLDWNTRQLHDFCGLECTSRKGDGIISGRKFRWHAWIFKLRLWIAAEGSDSEENIIAYEGVNYIYLLGQKTSTYLDSSSTFRRMDSRSTRSPCSDIWGIVLIKKRKNPAFTTWM